MLGTQVDIQLDRKLPHFVPLALVQLLRNEAAQALPYLTKEHIAALSDMHLLHRGRLSVQVSAQIVAHENVW